MSGQSHTLVEKWREALEGTALAPMRVVPLGGIDDGFFAVAAEGVRGSDGKTSIAFSGSIANCRARKNAVFIAFAFNRALETIAALEAQPTVVGESAGDTRTEGKGVFTGDEVVALANWQQPKPDSTDPFKFRGHPFTCANRGDGNHRNVYGDLGALVPTVRGWICPFCPYTQDWAHGFMKAEQL